MTVHKHRRSRTVTFALESLPEPAPRPHQAERSPALYRLPELGQHLYELGLVIIGVAGRKEGAWCGGGLRQQGLCFHVPM